VRFSSAQIAGFAVIVFAPCGCYHPIIGTNSREVFPMSDRDGNSFVWFLAGLGVGAAVGILYAPQSGSETREALRARAEEGRDYMKTRARDARNQASDWVDKGRDVVSQQKDQFRAAYEAGRQAYQEATTETTGAPKNL
jgi:gas vesicle protein